MGSEGANHERPDAQPSAYLLRAPRVITALDIEPLRDGAVRVREGEIVAVDAAARLGVEDGERVLDFEDATLLPGLIDAHEHLSGHDRYAIGDPSVQEPDTMYALVATSHCRRLLDEGVTTAGSPVPPATSTSWSAGPSERATSKVPGSSAQDGTSP